jgi:hypothetical protein
MKISQLLKVHHQYKSSKLHNFALCDGYLLNKNLIYKNLRYSCIQHGFSFKEAWNSYLTNPLLELDSILERKTIPVVNYLAMLTALERKRPGVFSISDLPLSFEAFHMHESAHCVANELFDTRRIKSEAHAIFRIMIGESFANACDSMAIYLAKDKTHKLIMSIHSYRQEDTKTRKLMDGMVKKWGLQNTFSFVFYSYLYSNFLYKSVSRGVVRNICERINPQERFLAKEASLAHSLFNEGFTLNIEFRTKTAMFYFKQKRFDKNILKLLDFDPLRLLERNVHLANLPLELTKIATSEVTLIS